MKRLYIVGAGGFGREVFSWAQRHPECGKRWKIAGFLDDDNDALEGFSYPVRVVGAPKPSAVPPDGCVVFGVGVPQIRRKLGEPFFGAGTEVLTLVDPSVIVGHNVKIGRGVVLCPGVVLSCDIAIGDGVMLNMCSTVGHDVRIGAWSTLSGNCELNGHCVLGEAVFMGGGSRLLPGKKAGDGAFVGIGSVVVKNVSPGVKVFGNPARPVA